MLQRFSILNTRNAIELLCVNGQRITLTDRIEFNSAKHNCIITLGRNWLTQKITLQYNQPNYTVHAILPNWCSWVEHKVIDNNIITPFMLKEVNNQRKIYQYNEEILHYNVDTLCYQQWLIKKHGHYTTLKQHALEIQLLTVDNTMHVQIDNLDKRIIVNYELLPLLI